MVERTVYGKLTPVITPPDQIGVQTKSFEEFLQMDVPPQERKEIGLQGVFKSIFPIQSFDGNYVLDFVRYEIKKGNPLNPQPKDNPLTALREGVTYSGSLDVTMQLKKGNEIIEETVYMGEIPLMTDSGAFIINGAERVIVSQLHRSPGICTEREKHANGTILYSVRIIPDRGSWLEFQFDQNRRISVNMDRRKKRRKFYASQFLRCLGYSTNREILQNFYTYRDLDTSAVSEGQLRNLVFPEDVQDQQTNALLAKRYEPVTMAIIRQLIQAGIQHVEVLDVTWDGGVFLETMRADTTTNQDEALKDVYHKLRPGDPVTASNATQLLKRMFFDSARYDLGKVGRYKLNQKLVAYRDPERGEEELPAHLRTLDKTDIIKALRLLGAVNTTNKVKKNERRPPQWKVATMVEVDDIDHLGSRRVRTAGELLENQCRLGLSRTERVIHERMSMASSQNEEDSSDTLHPTKLVNTKTFGSVINDFFARSQLSQFMDMTNPLSALAHKRRLSALGPGGLSRDRAGFEVRDVHPSHYGRICPIETPEGPNIGLISSLGIYAHINEYGFIETPYRRVIADRVNKTAHVTDEVVYMSADEEEKYVIAQANAPLDENNNFLNPMVRVRARADFTEAPRERVNFMDVSPMQVISIAAGLIPFLEHDDANRALMGANMMRQAVPLLRTERPFVATGLEGRAARDSRVIVIAKEDGIVAEVDATHIIVTKNGKKPAKNAKDNTFQRYDLQKFRRTNANSCFNQWPIVSQGQEVKKGQVLADGPATDQGELAIGKNLLVAYMPWCGYNFEDSILVSQRCVRDDTFTSVHITEVECTARETKLGWEEITRDIPNLGEDALRNLDERGVIRIGAEVKPGDILVGKITPKGESDLLPEERLLRAIFGQKAQDVRDTSLKVQPGTTGIVLDVKVSQQKDAKTDSHRLPSAAAALGILENGSGTTPKRKVPTEKEIRKEYNDRIKMLTGDLADEFSRKMLGKKIPLDIINGETGEVLVKQGEKLTKTRLLDLAKNRLSLKVETSPFADEINETIETFEPKFLQAEEQMKADLASLETVAVSDQAPIQSVKVYIAEKKTLSVGDKLSGRHGNKGVVCRILPDCDMPYLPNGQPMDIILNPMGVPSRMNLGQVFETHLGAACRALGIHAGTPVFDGVPEEQIRDMLTEASKQPDYGWIKRDGKSVLYDGRTGEPFEQRVMVGVTYMLKLHHLVTDKIHARSVGPYSLVTQQPLGGKAQAGGQRMGEMEVWALEAYGVAYTLQEMITVKSDDVTGRTRIYETIVKGQNTLEAGIPATFKVLMSELRGLCLDMRLESAQSNQDAVPANN